MVLSYLWQGVIPTEARAKIREAEALGVFDGIYLLAETDRSEWNVRTRIRPFERPRLQFDPLVVGYKDNQLWLITKFDPTTVEKYVAEEFSER
jgi:hypothetical protein